jgi:hypothetical protein
MSTVVLKQLTKVTSAAPTAQEVGEQLQLVGAKRSTSPSRKEDKKKDEGTHEEHQRRRAAQKNSDKTQPIGNPVHADDYLELRIFKNMQKKGMCRADAVRAALEKAHRKQYPVIHGDGGHAYGAALTALHPEGNFELSIGGNVLKSRKCIHHSDEEVSVTFSLPAQGMQMSRRGKYQLCGRVQNLPDMQFSGLYDLPLSSTALGAHLVPIKLYRQRHLENSVESQLPLSQLHVLCSPAGQSSAVVHNVNLTVFLRPQAAWQLQPLRSIPVYHERPVLHPTPHLFGFCSEDERVSSECTTRPGGLTEKLAVMMANRLGRCSAFRLSAHCGRQPIAQCSRGSESHMDFYRMGRSAEVLLNIALLSHIQECAPIEFGTPIDLDNPALTEYMLERSKSTRVIEGLRAAYGCVGTGQVPSIRQLMNHCSGLPENLNASTSIIDEILRQRQQQREEGGGRLELEDTFGALLEKRVRPLFPPGTQYHHSNLAIAVLRMMLPGDGLSLLRSCASELGMPTLCFPDGTPGKIRFAASCESHPVSMTSLHEAESPGYDVHTASARIDEVAQFLAASSQGCKHNWTGSGEGSKRYGFLTSMLVPKVTVHRESAHFHGFGFDHIGLKVQGFGSRGLRALVSVGKTPGHHQVIMCMVPALQLSFCIGTNSAPLDHKHTESLLTDIVSACAESIRTMENTRMKTATIFNPTLNLQLCQAPAACPRYAHHLKYCRGKPHALAQKDGRLEPFCTGEDFVSLMDTQDNLDSPIKLQVRCEKRTEERGGGHVYVLVEKYAHGEQMAHALAYDPDAIRDSETANQVYAAVQRGHPVDRRLTGMYRSICPRSGMLSEYVDMSSIRLDTRDDRQVDTRVVCFRGRVFVRRAMLDMIRRTIAPSLRDQVADTLASQSSIKSSSSSDATPLVSISAALSNSTLPDTTASGPPFRGGGGGGFRGGGAFRGGHHGPSWGYRGAPYRDGGYVGRPWGLGVGLGLGALAGAALWGPRYYGYGYPYNCYDPVTGLWIC